MGKDELVKADAVLPAMSSEFGTLAAVLKQNLSGEEITPFDLERISVPSGGQLFWTVATAEKPNGEARDKIAGVIVSTRLGRTFWAKGLGDAGAQVGTPPDCYSDDSVVGHGSPGGSCLECPNAQWGSAPVGGRGQACAQSRVLFVASPETALPRVIIAPPTSLKALKQYLTKLASLRLPFWAVTTELALKREVNKDGQPYASIVPSMGRTLTHEEIAQVQAFVEEMRPIFSNVRVEQSDLTGGKTAD